MYTPRTTYVIAALVGASLAGCASAPPENARLSQAEYSLKAAYASRYTAEFGNTDLAKAETSLAAARVALRKGRDGELDHELSMATHHIALGNIHGKQEEVKVETAALRDQQDRMRLASRDRDVRQANERADSALAQADVANAATQEANDRAQASADTADAEKKAAEAKLAAMHTQLAMYDMKFTELGATLVLRDVMFDVASSTLLPGAFKRLEPLIAYLAASPTTNVRIDGHTDSSGSMARNDTLSLDRANSVKRALQSNVSMTNVIIANGYGQGRPVATNATASGREQNRRVEITLQ